MSLSPVVVHSGCDMAKMKEKNAPILTGSAKKAPLLPPIIDIARHRRRYPHGVVGRGWGYAIGKRLGFGARPSAQASYQSSRPVVSIASIHAKSDELSETLSWRIAANA